MGKKSTFELAVMGVFVAFALVGVICFASGCFTEKKIVDYGSVTIWGTVPENMMRNVIKKVDITINIDYVQKTESRMREDMIEALASGYGPDLVILPSGSFVDYKRHLFQIPYDYISEREFKSSFIEQAEMYLGTEGIYAVPLTVDPMVMYWNRNIFASNGVSQVPSMWDEFKVLTPKMTQRDDTGAITRSTLPFGEAVNVTHAKDILSMLMMQLGASIISVDKGELSVDVNTPIEKVYPGTTALEFFIEFSNPALSTYNWNRSLPTSKEMFIAGDSAVYFGYASEIPEIEKTNPHLNFDVAMVPQKRSVDTKLVYGRMSGIAILNNSKNRTGAFEVLKLFSGIQTNDISFLESISEGLGLPPAHRVLLSKTPSDPYLEVFYDSANISKSWPDPDPRETDRIFENAVEGALSNRYTVNVAVTGLERQLEQIVQEFIKDTSRD